MSGLGGISDLSVRLAALEAKSRQVAPSTTTTIQSAAVVPTWKEVNPFVVLVASGAGAGWTTVNLSKYVPSGATRIVLNGYGSGDVTDNQDCELQVRKDANSIARLAMKYRSVAGAYLNNAAFFIEVPITVGMTFDYQITLNGFTTFALRLMEYLS